MLDFRIAETKRLSAHGQTRTQRDGIVARPRASVVVEPVAEQPPKCRGAWS